MLVFNTAHVSRLFPPSHYPSTLRFRGCLDPKEPLEVGVDVRGSRGETFYDSRCVHGDAQLCCRTKQTHFSLNLRRNPSEFRFGQILPRAKVLFFPSLGHQNSRSQDPSVGEVEKWKTGELGNWILKPIIFCVYVF